MLTSRARQPDGHIANAAATARAKALAAELAEARAEAAMRAEEQGLRNQELALLDRLETASPRSGLRRRPAAPRQV